MKARRSLCSTASTQVRELERPMSIVLAGPPDASSTAAAAAVLGDHCIAVAAALRLQALHLMACCESPVFPLRSCYESIYGMLTTF
jgi:hypothetical protein